MENKYYTPTIEEFNVGFRYEVNTVLDKWEKTTFEIDPFKINLTMIQGYLNGIKPIIRVKHLDHDDIIEAGWKLEMSDNGYRMIDKEGAIWDLWLYRNGIDIGPWREPGVTYLCRNYNELLLAMRMLDIKP